MNSDQQANPDGEVTFLFTDVEGSVRLWATDPDGTGRSFEVHDLIVKETIEAHRGIVFGTAGDSFRGAFADARQAVAAAIDCQARLATTDWADGPELKVRMGLHRGPSTSRGGDYFGPVPNTAARVEALGHGGQILMTEAVAELVDVDTLRLGEHRLRDVPEPHSIYQVGTGTHRPLRVIDPELSTLPNPGSPIVGRHQEIERIRGLMTSSPLITLTGAGGCGKTRLAVEVAYRELPSRPDGCYFADLSSVSSGHELIAAVALAIRLQLGTDDPLRRLVDHLASHQALLVLDNCEHLLDECAELVEELLSRAPSASVLATSRERLDVPGEKVLAVPPLLEGDGLTAAVELFVDRATAVNPDFVLTNDARPDVEEICERLDGLPLAIELAAARISVLSPADLLTRMGDRFRLLSGGRGRHRRRTLQAALDWGYDLLDDDEQRFFRRCGVFVGRFDLEAAVAVAALDDYGAMDLLDSLVAKSMVVLEEADGHRLFRLLETVRIYAGDQLARHDEVAAARDAHLAHYHSLGTTDDFAEAADMERSRWLRHQWPNLASALEWAAHTGEWTTAGQLALGCHGLWSDHIRTIEGRRWLELIIPNLDDELELQVALQRVLALLAMQLDDFELAHQLLGKLAAASDPAVRAEGLSLLAFAVARRDPQRSREMLDQADQLATEVELRPYQYAALAWARAMVALYEGHLEEADEFSRRSVQSGEREAFRISHHVLSSQSYAITRLLTGHPRDSLEILDAEDQSGSIWDCGPLIRAIALVDLDRPDEATKQVLAYADRALLGRMSRMANDALLGFAALAISRGDNNEGWRLLLAAITPRTPATIGLAEGLADRIGHGVDLRREHRDRETPLAELDASDALRAEVDKLHG